MACGAAFLAKTYSFEIKLIFTAKMVHHSGDGIMAQRARVCVCVSVFSCMSNRRVCLLCACLCLPETGCTASNVSQ